VNEVELEHTIINTLYFDSPFLGYVIVGNLEILLSSFGLGMACGIRSLDLDTDSLMGVTSCIFMKRLHFIVFTFFKSNPFTNGSAGAPEVYSPVNCPSLADHLHSMLNYRVGIIRSCGIHPELSLIIARKIESVVCGCRGFKVTLEPCTMV